MTVIKGSTEEQAILVRSLSGPPTAPANDGLSREADLEARIADLNAQIQSASNSLPAQLRAAREDGAREALEERSDAEAAALAQLEASLRDAQAAWSERLKTLDSLALGLARAALHQVLDDCETHASLISSCIRRQLERLDKNAVLRVRVSAADFGDGDQVAALSDAIGGALAIEADTNFEQGECLFDLRLGHVELSPRAQWRHIAELLDELEREGADK